jgi:hypothetical protein
MFFFVEFRTRERIELKTFEVILEGGTFERKDSMH